MWSKLDFKKIVIVPLVAIIFIGSFNNAYAWGGGSRWRDDDRHGRDSHHNRHHHYPRYGDSVFALSAGFLTVYLHGNRYYYSEGVYYRPQGTRYVVVAPPAQAYVYVPTPTVVSTTGVVNAPIPDPLTVNIPNNQGGYTSVTLKKSGSGYVGPQGEFYPQFPTVEQLKVLYVK